MCPRCSMTVPRIMMVGKTCYFCILRNPPKTLLGVNKYKKAVSIALSFATPLTYNQSLEIVNSAGLKNINFLNDLQQGRRIPQKPASEYYGRVKEVIASLDK